MISHSSTSTQGRPIVIPGTAFTTNSTQHSNPSQSVARVQRRRKSSILFLLLIILTSIGSRVFAQEVEDPILLAGGVFSTLLPKGTPTPFIAPRNHTPKWVAIPSWLAGTWQAREQTIYQAYSYVENRQTVTRPIVVRINRVSRLGVQRDTSGQIWHYTGSPYLRVINTPSYIERQHIERIEVLEVLPGEYSVQSTAVVTHIDKKSNELVEVFKEVTTTRYKPLGTDFMEVSFDVLDFSAGGMPLRSSYSACIEWRIKPFRTVNSDERGNLSRLFKEFLKHPPGSWND